MNKILKFLCMSIVVFSTSSILAQSYYDEYGNLVQPRSQIVAPTSARSARSATTASQTGTTSARSARSTGAASQTGTTASRSARSTGATSQTGTTASRSARSTGATSQTGATSARSARSVGTVSGQASNRATRSARSAGTTQQASSTPTSSRSARSSRTATSSRGTTSQTARSSRGRAAVSRGGVSTAQPVSASRAGVSRAGITSSVATTGTTSLTTTAATTTSGTAINYAELIPTSTVNTTGKTAEEVVILLGNEKSCKEQYIKCMDPLCSDSDTESKIGRCLCSGSISAQSTKEKELNKILANISQMQWQSKNLELAKSKSDLDGTDFDYALEEVTEEALVQLGVTDAKSATDDDIFEVFLGDVTEKTVRKEGNAKLQEANKTCQTTLEICPDSKKLIVDSYAILAGNDCRVYSTDLEKKIFENKIVLQNAYNQYQMKGTEYNIKTKNKMNSQECATALTSCMKSEDICGLTYEFCATDGDLEGKKALCSSVLNQCQQANNPTLPKGEKRTAATTDVLWKSFKTNAITQSAALNIPEVVAVVETPIADMSSYQSTSTSTTGNYSSGTDSSSGYSSVESSNSNVSSTPTISAAQTACEGSFGAWENDSCSCVFGYETNVNGQCVKTSKALACETDGKGTWDYNQSAGGCTCNEGGYELNVNGNCSLKSTFIACTSNDKGQWINENCSCAFGYETDSAGICVEKAKYTACKTTPLGEGLKGIYELVNEIETCSCPTGYETNETGECVKTAIVVACEVENLGTWDYTKSENGCTCNLAGYEVKENGSCSAKATYTSCISNDKGTWKDENCSCAFGYETDSAGICVEKAKYTACKTTPLGEGLKGIYELVNEIETCSCPTGYETNETGECVKTAIVVACEVENLGTWDYTKSENGCTCNLAGYEVKENGSCSAKATYTSCISNDKGTWKDESCSCAFGYETDSNGVCVKIEKALSCEIGNLGTWDYTKAEGGCTCSTGYEISSEIATLNQCVKTNEVKSCETNSRGDWDFTKATGGCSCREGFVLDGETKECISKLQANCKATAGATWENGKCSCEKNSSGMCMTSEELTLKAQKEAQRKACKKSGGSWSKSTCSCPVGTQKSGDVCEKIEEKPALVEPAILPVNVEEIVKTAEPVETN